MDNSFVAKIPLVIRNTSGALSNASVNKLLPEDSAAHSWYRFVLSYPPQLVRHYIDKFGLTDKDVILDPFCGTGTTVVEAKKMGIPSIGIEANPVAHFAGSVKTNWSVSGAKLIAHAQVIASKTRARLAAEGIREGERPNLKTVTLKRLSAEHEKLILKNSISPLPLHKTLTLIDEIGKAPGVCQKFERLALARAIVGDIGNLQFGPEVGVGKLKEDALVLEPWLRYVERISADVDLLGKLPDTPSVIHNADARVLANILKPKSVSAVITSPPYPNEKDYSRTTRLEGVLLGFMDSKAELKRIKQTFVRSNTRSVYRGDTDDEWISNMPEIHAIADQIEAKRIHLGKDSGFERMYPRVTRLYFGGMAKHLADMRAVLRPGAKLAYVVGDQASYLQVLIQTGRLLALIAERLGYRVISLDLFRTRLSTATRQQLREEVIVLEWKG